LEDAVASFFKVAGFAGTSILISIEFHVVLSWALPASDSSIFVDVHILLFVAFGGADGLGDEG
jgi:uncharacterized membrane protein